MSRGSTNFDIGGESGRHGGLYQRRTKPITLDDSDEGVPARYSAARPRHCESITFVDSDDEGISGRHGGLHQRRTKPVTLDDADNEASPARYSGARLRHSKPITLDDSDEGNDSDDEGISTRHRAAGPRRTRPITLDSDDEGISTRHRAARPRRTRPITLEDSDDEDTSTRHRAARGGPRFEGTRRPHADYLNRAPLAAESSPSRHRGMSTTLRHSSRHAGALGEDYEMASGGDRISARQFGGQRDLGSYGGYDGGRSSGRRY